MRVLITGIDGFTGRYLKRYLKNYEVYGTSIDKEYKNIFKCDITKEDEVKRVIEKVNPDILIHLAAISFVAHGSKENFYKVNVIGTENLLENFSGKKFILASSAVVYGRQNSEVLSEDMSPNPNNHYGFSKFAAEQISKNYFDKFDVVILRPFNYTGPCQSEKFLIPKIVNHYKKRAKSIRLGNLDVIREFNDIDFVCEVYRRVIESNIKSEIINIASSRGIKLLDVIKLMNEIAGYEIEVIKDERFIRKNDIKKLIGDSTKLKTLLGDIKVKDFKILLKEMYESSC